MLRTTTIFGAAAILAAGLWTSDAAADSYTVGELLKPCQEGDNSARWGAAAEAECEQYIRGFTDAYILAGAHEQENVCLPEQNRLDEVRWAFMRWAYENFEQRGAPAAEGVVATIRARFMCR